MKNLKIISKKYSTRICFKCLKEVEPTNIKIIDFYETGNGSLFNGFNSKMQLCNECYQQCDEDMWKLNIITNKEDNEDIIKYENESELIDYISSLPIEGQELFLNRIAWGKTVIPMKGQDWIDYILHLLPYEKCKEYGLMSPIDNEVYKERFPTCKYPVNIVYNDGVKKSRCPYGTIGNYNQIADCASHIKCYCYECPYYEKRNNDELIFDLSEDEYKLYKLNFLYYINKEKIEKLLKEKRKQNV